MVDDAVVRVWGEGTSWTARPTAPGGEPEVAAGGDRTDDSSGSSSRHREVAEIPAVQTVLELFQGRVETVEDRAGATED